MKTLISKNKTNFFILLLGFSLAICSCQKEEVNPAEPDTVAEAGDPVKDKEVVILP